MFPKTLAVAISKRLHELRLNFSRPSKLQWVMLYSPYYIIVSLASNEEEEVKFPHMVRKEKSREIKVKEL